MGLLIRVDPFVRNFFHLFFILLFTFLFINKLYFFSVYDKNELKWLDILFYFFIVSNLLGLSSFFLSFPLWPLVMIFISFTFWGARVLNLFKIRTVNLVSHFAQVGLRLFMCCCMVFIEVISLCIRRLTLAFRLLANILGGHLILELAGENRNRWLLIIGLSSYEVFVRIVQAIIFSILVYYYSLESLEKY